MTDESTSKPASILFVCIGNTCRGPMAEQLARARWPQHRFESAGIRELKPGEEVSPHVAAALKRVKIAMTDHKPRSVHSLDLSRFDYIVAMEPSVAKSLERDFRVSADRIVTLGVTDPYREDLVIYVKCLRQIEAEFAKLSSKLQ